MGWKFWVPTKGVEAIDLSDSKEKAQSIETRTYRGLTQGESDFDPTIRLHDNVLTKTVLRSQIS